MMNDETPLYIPEPEEVLLGQEPRDPEKDAEREQTKREKAELREVYIRKLMGEKLFREWLMENLTGFETFSNPFGTSPNGSPDHDGTQFRLGLKAAGWHLWEQVDNVAPELASLMRREAVRRSP